MGTAINKADHRQVQLYEDLAKEFCIMERRLTFSLILGPVCLVALGAPGVAFGLPPAGEWGVPINVEDLPGSSKAINSPSIDGCVSLSRDGLELYFTSFRDGSADIFVAERASLSDGFGSPRKLPPTVNTVANDACPTLVGRNSLYYLRSEGADQGNLFVSRRNSSDWLPAKPVNPAFNTPMLEESVSIFEDEQGHEVVIFSRRNPDGSGGVILQSIAGDSPVPLEGGPNAAGSNNRPWVSRDGRLIAFDSDRPGGQGGPDIWFAERDSTDDPFGPAYTLPELNSPGNDLRPAFTWDQTQMFFSSSRAGSESPAPDIWMAERRRLRGPKIIEFPGGRE